MRAEELRIGNWVYIPQLKKHSQIGAIEENGRFITKNYSSSFSSIECLQPIPLTEEWLLKFGFRELSRFTHDFEEVIYGKSIIHNYDNHSEMLVISIPFCHAHIGEYLIDEDYYMNIEVKHVHQLQNLYFALTGEELKYKPEVQGIEDTKSH